MILPFCQKSKDNFFRKNTLKVTFPVLLKKDDIHLRNMVFLLKYHIDLHSRLIF